MWMSLLVYYSVLVYVIANDDEFSQNNTIPVDDDDECDDDVSATLKVYWNIPSFQCDYHKLNFTGLAEKYGIIQNDGDRFRGNQITILYDPGDFPAILRNGNELFLRNGGVPQEGNLTLHLEVFQESVEILISDLNYAGVGVIDFESWRPIFRQNFGSLEPYKDLSLEIEKQKHPFWSKSQLEKEATRRFEIAGRQYMEETLILAKQMRPNATWGYYAYPYCFNMSPKNMREQCPADVLKENDRLKWLFEISENLYPSLYLSETRLDSGQKLQMIEGRINEARRVSQNNAKIIPYFWYKYQDTKAFLSKEDLYNAFLAMKASRVDGIILWGSSNDVNSKKNCYDLFNFIDLHLGPALINT